MRVLVTGGGGYIGSHMALMLAQHACAVTIVDDCSTGHRAVGAALQRAVPGASILFEECALDEVDRVTEMLSRRRINAVIHFAARASISESFVQPAQYWKTNLDGTRALLTAMHRAAVHRLIFSSSCATYGVVERDSIPIKESCPQHPINPYGESKLAAEHEITQAHSASTASGGDFSYAILRYFNVIGSDPQARIGEVHDPEFHLVPSCLLAALGRRGAIEILGDDHHTLDGTCIRDYVDVNDVCTAHLAALKQLKARDAFTFNVGSGRGHSVREVINACARVTRCEIPAVCGPRRVGDPPELIADASEIHRVLGWSPATLTLDESIENAWRWLRRHPQGYSALRTES